MHRCIYARINIPQYIDYEQVFSQSMSQSIHILISLNKSNEADDRHLQADFDRNEKDINLTPDIYDNDFHINTENSSGSRRSQSNSVTRDSQHRSHGRRLPYR
eukprot:15064990-Heterocapsa_arctica.AAC.1